MEIKLNELKSAFKKLQAHSYYDNYDLFLRKKIAYFKKDLKNNFETFIIESNKINPFESLFKNNVSIHFLPKQVDIESPKMPLNFYTNVRILNRTRISRPFVFCDLPIEFHLISVIWILRFGSTIEEKLYGNALGNRLITINDKYELAGGRALFHTYIRQFQKWSNNATKAAKELLDNNNDATIINFDIHSFYNTINFDFNKLEDDFPEMRKDKIHSILVKIHESYSKILSKYRKGKVDISINKYPLPIGLLTSHVLANWYLTGFDKFILETLKPHYYGRYVDDIFIVVNNTILKNFNIVLNNDKTQNESNQINEIIRSYIDTHLKNVLKVSNDLLEINLAPIQYSHLKLNKNKFFIYQFESKYSPNLIEKFEDDQKEKSSMFRFLSDEEDEYFDEFDKITFESNFDSIDANKAQFKNIEDNKFKISSYFSKIIKRRLIKGHDYKNDEVDKIDKYFKGPYLIRHYYFWEKLLTLYLVFNRGDLFKKLIDEVVSEIKLIQVNNSKSTESEFRSYKILYVNSLTQYLKSALSMAIGLNPNFLYENLIVMKSLAIKLEKMSLRRLNIIGNKKKIVNKYTIFKSTGLLRGNFIYYKILQFTKGGLLLNLDLTSGESIFENKLLHYTKQLIINENLMEFIPFTIKFWHISLWLYYRTILELKINFDKKNKTNFDKLFSGDLLIEALRIFKKINSLENDTIDNEYFKLNRKEIFNDYEKKIDLFLQEVFITNGERRRDKNNESDKIKICIVNKYISSNDFDSSLKGKPNMNKNVIEIYDRILDQISTIKNCDIFVMPELSLPHKLMHHFTEQAERNQIGFVSGVEYLRLGRIGYNFVLTVLPINVRGVKDAVPILRLKNHYAPAEIINFNQKKISIPNIFPYRYDLFIWRKFYFSTYYCFELANVFHRSAFFSLVDAIIAPVWNKDTHYYNSLIDSATRDMHNYFILVNTSQYGFSKVSRPSDHIHKEKVLVKGGTEKGYEFTLLVGDLEIKELRKFQQLSDYSKSDLVVFKPTPPDFNKENVKKRIHNQSFFEETDKIEEEEEMEMENEEFDDLF